MRTARIAIGALSMLIGTLANAEPTPLVSRFMNQPVSLFSLGMYRLGIEVGNYARNAGFSFGSADYNWDSNEIEIRATAYSATSSLKCANAQACGNDLREALSKFASSYALQLNDGSWLQFVTGQFTPEGYEQKQFYGGKTSSQAALDLVKLVKISATLHAQDGVTYECRRELESTEVFCSAGKTKKP